MNHPQPTISVVIPTYNRVQSLRRTLAGLARQTIASGAYEVIVVSDGSTDGTAAFVRAHAAAAPYPLRLLEQENAGPSRARNHGVECARGSVIVFLDDDVEPSPALLAAHAVHHHVDDRAVVIGPMLPDPARRSEPVWIAWEHAMLQKQYDAWRIGAWKGVGPNHFYSGNASIRREHLLAVGGFDEAFTRQEDVELAYRLERECDVHFAFDAAAAGIHRPNRSRASWERVPAAYGTLDVRRARRSGEDGAAARNFLDHAYRNRNAATRALAAIVTTCPLLSSPIGFLLILTATVLYRLPGGRSAAFAALSALYNVRYLEAARRAVQAETATPVALRELAVAIVAREGARPV